MTFNCDAGYTFPARYCAVLAYTPAVFFPGGHFCPKVLSERIRPGRCVLAASSQCFNSSLFMRIRSPLPTLSRSSLRAPGTRLRHPRSSLPDIFRPFPFRQPHPLPFLLFTPLAKFHRTRFPMRRVQMHHGRIIWDDAVHSPRGGGRACAMIPPVAFPQPSCLLCGLQMSLTHYTTPRHIFSHPSGLPNEFVVTLFLSRTRRKPDHEYMRLGTFRCFTSFITHHTSPRPAPVRLRSCRPGVQDNEPQWVPGVSTPLQVHSLRREGASATACHVTEQRTVPPRPFPSSWILPSGGDTVHPRIAHPCIPLVLVSNTIPAACSVTERCTFLPRPFPSSITQAPQGDSLGHPDSHHLVELLLSSFKMSDLGSTAALGLSLDVACARRSSSSHSWVRNGGLRTPSPGTGTPPPRPFSSTLAVDSAVSYVVGHLPTNRLTRLIHTPPFFPPHLTCLTLSCGLRTPLLPTPCAPYFPTHLLRALLSAHLSGLTCVPAYISYFRYVHRALIMPRASYLTVLRAPYFTVHPALYFTVRRAPHLIVLWTPCTLLNHFRACPFMPDLFFFMFARKPNAFWTPVHLLPSYPGPLIDNLTMTMRSIDSISFR
ncbi:hypothetical protein FB45DRAFT_1036967 [Roridomyces roridus]|uniref:Uncharacterized protein n=1 Tax=Roridomyces roridus TaxID=1738132 RepID=A0AAD7B7W4_9AGAR|nr:hypothetical protein FB45DRAFT_1036967 [Roridomyces roridus]